ncbi:MAG: hypothetical protein ACLR7Z_02230 [Bilophila wadsworthia]
MGAPVYDGTWTPLVTYRMGISALGTPFQPSCHIWRETYPCRALTPLARNE